MSVFGEECFEAHVYLDHHYPPIQWNIVRGVFHSPECLPVGERKGLLSVSMASMLLNNAVDRLISELQLEHIRAKNYPDNVSRLKGIFVFDDIESLSNLWKNNSWGGHFCDEYLADVGVSSIRSSRLDSNWIADVVNHDGKLKPDWESAAHNYWQGNAHPERLPIWERIIEGSITVWSMNSKQSALQEVQAIWPQSLNILRHSICCGGYGSFDGEVFPILTISENSIKISHYIRLVQSSNPRFMEGLKEFVSRNPKFQFDLGNSGENCVPDLTGFNRELAIDGNVQVGDLMGDI